MWGRTRIRTYLVGINQLKVQSRLKICSKSTKANGSRRSLNGEMVVQRKLLRALLLQLVGKPVTIATSIRMEKTILNFIASQIWSLYARNVKFKIIAGVSARCAQYFKLRTKSDHIYAKLQRKSYTWRMSCSILCFR